ncbi:aminoglycoside phosphotransferase family protein [Actinomadura sp. LCR2-06]|uniref:Aminoglycoside phosphotransferase family protein n=1 Tax=Actinomadura violacea TaxID=2819934 RepID=A0ABS3RXQ2_9ACTN|nr:aminoglycoside phosphotransferase family protein [Actinomadura violacea]
MLLGPVADNAVFRIPAARLVVRVASSVGALPRVERELRVARWLASQGFSAVRPAEAVEQPVVDRERVITFWEEIEDPRQATPAEMGALLRRLHALPAPPAGLVEPLEPFVRQRSHINSATGIDAEDRDFLRDVLVRLQAAYADLEFALPTAVIHGDPHRKNIVVGGDGIPVLLDLERFSLGPPEWDLTVPAVYRNVGWYDDAEYAAFTDAYGLDVTGWEGFTTLAAIRELRMTAWLAARTGREPRLIGEAQRRIASLRDPTAPRRWTPGT